MESPGRATKKAEINKNTKSIKLQAVINAPRHVSVHYNFHENVLAGVVSDVTAMLPPQEERKYVRQLVKEALTEQGKSFQHFDSSTKVNVQQFADATVFKGGKVAKNAIVHKYLEGQFGKGFDDSSRHPGFDTSSGGRGNKSTNFGGNTNRTFLALEEIKELENRANLLDLQSNFMVQALMVGIVGDEKDVDRPGSVRQRLSKKMETNLAKKMDLEVEALNRHERAFESKVADEQMRLVQWMNVNLEKVARKVNEVKYTTERIRGKNWDAPEGTPGPYNPHALPRDTYDGLNESAKRNVSLNYKVGGVYDKARAANAQKQNMAGVPFARSKEAQGPLTEQQRVLTNAEKQQIVYSDEDFQALELLQQRLRMGEAMKDGGFDNAVERTSRNVEGLPVVRGVPLPPTFSTDSSNELAMKAMYKNNINSSSSRNDGGIRLRPGTEDNNRLKPIVENPISLRPSDASSVPTILSN